MKMEQYFRVSTKVIDRVARKGAVLSVKIVVIDPGHGGHDPGASEDDLIEKEIALRLGKMIANRLKTRYEVDVRMTRDTDCYVELSNRAAFANQLGADYFVSVHHNRAGGSGFESFVYPGTQDGITGKMQQAVHEQIMSFMHAYHIQERGRKTANFTVLRETKMPAILLEFLFVDHDEDAKWLRKEFFLQGTADATVKGIANALQLSAKQSRNDLVSVNDRFVSSKGEALKQEAVNWLYEQGLLTDERWRSDLDAPVPLWVIAVILQRLKSKE